MRFPRLRISVRTMMVLVAVAAFLFAGELMRRRIVECRTKAAAHEVIELRVRGMVEGFPNFQRTRFEDGLRRFEQDEREMRHLYKEFSMDGFEDEIAKNCSEYEAYEAKDSRFWQDAYRENQLWMQWHARMKRHYLHAMWRPWEAVEKGPAAPVPMPDSYDVRSNDQSKNPDMRKVLKQVP